MTLHLIRHEPPVQVRPEYKAATLLAVAEAIATDRRECFRIDLPPRDGLGRLVGHYLAIHPQGNWHRDYVSWGPQQVIELSTVGSPAAAPPEFLYLEWIRDEEGWFESPITREEAVSLIEDAQARHG